MKPKAPAWLRESFRDGVDERLPRDPDGGYLLISTRSRRRLCWLAEHDPLCRPCEGKFERFHFIPRQRVEHALYALFPWPTVPEVRELILLAAWDPRNGGLACKAHHRRFDGHMTPTLTIPRSALPAHVIEFAEDWGLESQLEQRFPEREEAIR